MIDFDIKWPSLLLYFIHRLSFKILMEIAELEEAWKVIDSCISRMKWRLRSASKRRLEIDILALCSGLRSVVMVDYGGKMPELQEHLCKLVHLAKQESFILHPLRIMVIEEMIYIVHIKGLKEHLSSSLQMKLPVVFVDLESDPPKMLSQTDGNSTILQFISIRKLFSSVFCAETHILSQKESSEKLPGNDPSCLLDYPCSSTSEFIDMSRCMQETEITIPTLNGWLLGYPVVYLFRKDHIADAMYNLSTKSLNIFQIFVSRNQSSIKGLCDEELMSFTVPYNLSLNGTNEPWAEAFLTHMLLKYEGCKSVWCNLKMEVKGCCPQSIVL